MKSYLLSLGLVVMFVTAGLLSVAADDLPKALTFARYEAMKNRSPFAVASAVVAPAATPNFAKDLYIANGARTPDADLITLASTTDKSFKKYLTTKEPVEGYRIEKIEWSDRVGQTKVTIGKDGQTAALTFNQALLSQSVANSAPPQPIQPQMQQASGVVAPVPQYNPNGVKPGGPIPTFPTPPPRTRGQIQRNPNAGPPALPQAQPEQKQEALIQDE